MANLDNTENQTHIGDRINDPIRSLADAILIIVAGKFFTTGRSRIGGKILNALDDAETPQGNSSQTFKRFLLY